MAGEDELMLDAALPAEVETNLHLRRAPLADSVPGAAVPRTRLAEDEAFAWQEWSNDRRRDPADADVENGNMGVFYLCE
ncbi:hypothetical protein AURDEDRAFT_165723 [Auricularia subglabra TFB-10046 SS5]|nr:hypothetical protein AURDEDRAFT_165723 [Auricularia subglabra TFB-10046 SS5]